MFDFGVYNPAIYAASKLTLLKLISDTTVTKRFAKEQEKARISEVLAYMYAYDWLEAHEDRFKSLSRRGSVSNIHELEDPRNHKALMQNFKLPSNKKNLAAPDYINAWLDAKNFKPDAFDSAFQEMHDVVLQQMNNAIEEGAQYKLIITVGISTLVSVAIMGAFVLAQQLHPLAALGGLGGTVLGIVYGVLTLHGEEAKASIKSQVCDEAVHTTKPLLRQTFPLQNLQKQALTYDFHGDNLITCAQGARNATPALS